MSYAHPPDDPAELAALYAAGAMPREECLSFEAHLAEGCPACAAEINRLDPVLIALADAVAPVAPDPRTLETLLQRIARRPTREGTPMARSGALYVQKASAAAWVSTGIDGVQMRVMFIDREQKQFTALVRMGPGTSYPSHSHGGTEECLVLEGDLHVGQHDLSEGDYQRAPAGTTHDVQTTEKGCLLLLKAPLSEMLKGKMRGKKS